MQENLPTRRSPLLSVSVRLGLSLALGILAILLLVGLAPAASSPLAQTGTQASINLDTTFGAGGVVSTSVGSDWDIAHAVAIQEDGRIVAAGIAYSGSGYNFAVVRYRTEIGSIYLPQILRNP